MADRFGATSTGDEVLSGINLHGKRILVTGVSAGIGVETARSLARALFVCICLVVVPRNVCRGTQRATVSVLAFVAENMIFVFALVKFDVRSTSPTATRFMPTAWTPFVFAHLSFSLIGQCT